MTEEHSHHGIIFNGININKYFMSNQNYSAYTLKNRYPSKIWNTNLRVSPVPKNL